MDRRTFVGGVMALMAAETARANVRADEEPSAAKIPRWRGFNLQGRFPGAGRPTAPEAYSEDDLAMMAEWGFDFARLPLSYWVWGSRDDWSIIREEPLTEIDRVIELGRKHGIHINLNFHRIPGYCINGREMEPFDLFTGRAEERARARDAAVHHWQAFARRYEGIPNKRLSFDLLNEPPKMRSYEGALEERYVEIVHALVAGIRDVDPGRLIFADGMDIGQAPVLGIVDLGLVQSTRGYLPKAVSHHTASWVPADEFESTAVPTWPLVDAKGQTWNKERLRKELIERYSVLTGKGVQIHVGEWGVHNKTPHAVALAWMEDCLSLWKEAGWGFALWNLRGSFGIMDSERTDVAYEDFKGRKLDRKMLDLLRRY